MADNFPNLPSIRADVRENRLLQAIAPSGPTVAVLGTAETGPSKTETQLVTAPSAVTEFGLNGTLGRGIVEVFQGGADNVRAYRVLATKGRVKHIGDSAGTDGYIVETVDEGSHVLGDLEILYNNEDDILKIYDADTGELVYDNDADEPVDLGVVSVTGEKVAGNLWGSIGLQVPVQTVEADQIFTVPDDTIMTSILVSAGAGLNLSLLGVLAAGEVEYVAICKNAAGTVVEEREVSAYDPATRVVTLASGLTALSFPEAANHEIIFVSRIEPIAADEILTNRLYVTADGSPLKVTPGSNYNGLAKVLTDATTVGLTVETDAGDALSEVSPSKINFYEAMEDSFLALEASSLDIVVMPGVYLDDDALDGEVSVPDILLSSEAGDGGVDDIASVTIAGRADMLELDFDDNTDKAAAEALLDAAGRGTCFITILERQGTAAGATFGYGHTAGELVRTARILNWETGSAADKLYIHLDRDLSFSLDAVGGTVVASEAPTFHIYNNVDDVLFYHNAFESAGALVHQWYPAKTDLDGHPYHEVNFGYRMAKFCQDMTENERVVIGSIGMNPPSNHFNPAAISTWIGRSPVFDTDGEVSTNGTGLLGNKFLVGREIASEQFDPGFLATEDGFLDDTDLVQDGNGYDVDMGKYMSVVASWPIVTNQADATGLGYVTSGAPLYAGFLSSLPGWSGATAKKIGGRGIKLPVKLAKRHQDSLVGARYVIFDQRPDGVIVVDAPSAALPVSDYTRNMTVRLVGTCVQVCRDIARNYLGDPLSAIRKAALETGIKKGLSDVQRLSGGALESFELAVTQSALDKVRGTAELTLTLQVINELRKITVNVALTT